MAHLKRKSNARRVVLTFLSRSNVYHGHTRNIRHWLRIFCAAAAAPMQTKGRWTQINRPAHLECRFYPSSSPPFVLFSWKLWRCFVLTLFAHFFLLFSGWKNHLFLKIHHEDIDFSKNEKFSNFFTLVRNALKFWIQALFNILNILQASLKLKFLIEIFRFYRTFNFFKLKISSMVESLI